MLQETVKLFIYLCTTMAETYSIMSETKEIINEYNIHYNVYSFMFGSFLWGTAINKQLPSSICIQQAICRIIMDITKIKTNYLK